MWEGGGEEGEKNQYKRAGYHYADDVHEVAGGEWREKSLDFSTVSSAAVTRWGLQGGHGFKQFQHFSPTLPLFTYLRTTLCTCHFSFQVIQLKFTGRLQFGSRLETKNQIFLSSCSFALELRLKPRQYVATLCISLTLLVLTAGNSNEGHSK